MEDSHTHTPQTYSMHALCIQNNQRNNNHRVTVVKWTTGTTKWIKMCLEDLALTAGALGGWCGVEVWVLVFVFTLKMKHSAAIILQH